MAKRRRVKSGIDRINALPDDLLCHILSFLPTESTVRASLLSKRWRYLHTLISSIDIIINQRHSYPKPEKLDQLINFVESDLLSRRSIQRFRVEWSRNGDRVPINGWIAALLCHNIQELELCFLEIPFLPCNVLLASLFFSETLVVFKLVNLVASDHYSLKIPDEVCLPKLKVLHIRETMVRDAQLNKLLSSCPVLDDLFLDKVFPHDSRDPCRLDISNATIRRLAIHSLSPSQFPSLVPAVEVVINCPALEYLSFYLLKDQSLVLLAKQCLAEVAIGGYQWRLPKDFVNAHELDVFKEIKYIQSLKLHNYHLLQGMCKCKVDLPLFESLTYLKLSDSNFLFDPRCLEYILAQCVVLKTLVIEVHCLPSSLIVKERNNIKYALEQSRLIGLLCHLKTVKFQIQLYRTEDAEKVLMKIIKFFLNNAKILEELTISFQYIQDTQQSRMVTELSTIPRVSKNCRVVLNDAIILTTPKVKSLKTSHYNYMRNIHNHLLGLSLSTLVNSINKSKKN